jgi:hypothetical protein
MYNFLVNGELMCYYDFEEFRLACSRGSFKVIIWGCAEEGAKEHFGLTPKANILRFIYNRGLENLRFRNTREWEKNPNPNKPIFIDSYEFYTRNKLGYIAFMNNGIRWVLKSFKLSDRNITEIEEEIYNKNIMELVKGK